MQNKYTPPTTKFLVYTYPPHTLRVKPFGINVIRAMDGGAILSLQSMITFVCAFNLADFAVQSGSFVISRPKIPILTPCQ